MCLTFVSKCEKHLEERHFATVIQRFALLIWKSYLSGQDRQVLAESSIAQGCRNRGGRVMPPRPTSRFILTDQLTLSQLGGRLCRPNYQNYYVPQRIFRPSYGRVLSRLSTVVVWRKILRGKETAARTFDTTSTKGIYFDCLIFRFQIFSLTELAVLAAFVAEKGCTVCKKRGWYSVLQIIEPPLIFFKITKSMSSGLMLQTPLQLFHLSILLIWAVCHSNQLILVCDLW